MTQHDMNVANGTGAVVRADINDALVALANNSAGASAPATTFANMFWFDTTNHILKKRDESNASWHSVALFNDGGGTFSWLGEWDITSLTALTAPAVGDELGIYDLDVTTIKKITLENMFKVVAGFTSLTAPATGDSLAIYDTSAAAIRNILLSDLFKTINVLTSLTAPAVDDVLAAYDTSGTAAAGISFANFLKVVNGLTEDTTPDTANDFLLAYDTSAGEAKKVLLSKVGGAGLELIGSSALSGSAVVFTSIPATYSFLHIEIVGASGSGSGDFTLRVSTNNGSSYDSTATNYDGLYWESANTVALSALASLVEKGSSSYTSGGSYNMTAELIGYQGSGYPTYIGNRDGSVAVRGIYKGSASAIDAIQFAISTGTFDAGNIYLYGGK